MDTGETGPLALTSTTRLRGPKSALSPLIPEVDAYLHLLVLIFLMESKEPSGENLISCAESLMRKMVAAGQRRTMDPLAARGLYYYAQAYEKLGRLAEIRGFLHSRLRTSTLRNDFEGQAVIINCLLRSYIAVNQYDQVIEAQ